MMDARAGVRLETERLLLRELEDGDACFIVTLLNDPDFLKYIGDKNVRNEEDARAYIANGPAASYAENGHGLYHVALRDGTPIGICGLVKRPTLPTADIGYAFLPDFRGQGYALEAGRAVLEHGRSALGVKDVLAIVTPSNADSVRLLEKLGLSLKGPVQLTEGADEVLLFSN